MRFRKKLPPLAMVVGLIAWLTASISPAAVAPRQPSALEWAFQFASAIQTDQSDQTRAQADVIVAWLDSDALDAATNQVEKITTWRRGACWGEIAVALANRGNTNAALQAIRRTEKLQAGVHGDWQKPRVTMHLAKAHLAAGNLDTARELMRSLPAEEAVKVKLAIVNHLLRDGKHSEALAELKTGRGSKNFMVDAGLVEGYIAVAGNAKAPDQRELFAETLQLFETLPGLPQTQLAPDLAVGLFQAGDHVAATNLLARIETLLKSAEPRFRAPGLARLAIAWGKLGEAKQQERLLREVTAVAMTGDPLDQPATCAAVGGLLAEQGDREGAWKLYRHGLETAAHFANARPRALGMVDLCCSIGRHKLSLDAACHQRLSEIFNGLGDPW